MIALFILLVIVAIRARIVGVSAKGPAVPVTSAISCYWRLSGRPADTEVGLQAPGQVFLRSP